jgi:flagellar assembly protein FliH
VALSQNAAGLVPSVDQAVSTEEIRLIERAAEERGYDIGRNRAEAELRAAVEGASALADKLQAIAPERTSEIAHSIAELALSVARRIVQHEVRIEPSLLCASLEAAVSTINGSPEAHVLLNPAAVEAVAQAWEALHGRAYLGKKWFFEGDPTLPVGGCTLRYEHGFVEAGLESQLEEIGIALDRAIPNLARGTVEEEVA